MCAFERSEKGMEFFMNKKPMIIMGVFFGIIIIGLIVLLVLELTTDIFTAASDIFRTTLQNNMSNINNSLDLSKEQDYIKTLLESNYRENTKAIFKYTNSKETVENFNIILSGITNNSEKNSYKNAIIKYGEDLNIMNLQYLRENKKHGLLFSNIVNQFVCADIEKIEDLLDILGIDKQKYEEYDISEVVNTFINKKENLEKICLDYFKNVNNKRFQKKKNVQVSLNNGETINANMCSVQLSKDQTKELYIEILKELGKKIEIKEINTTKRQFSETEVALYTVDNKIARLTIEVENKQIKIDFMDYGLNIKYNELTTEEIRTYNVEIKKQNANTSIKYSDSYNNIVNLEYNLSEDNSKKNAKIRLDIQNDYIKGANLYISQGLECSNTKIDGFIKSFSENANINLSNLKINDKNNAVSGLLHRINLLLIKRNNQINSEILNYCINFNKNLEEQYRNIKDQQKKIFNNQFLTYKGQDVEKEIIYNLLELAGRNMRKYETVGEDSFDIYISEGIKNIELAEEVKAKIKELDKSFSINFGYNSDGKINLIKIQGYDKQ